MRPYPQYKDSGVDWIGEIPQSWIKSKFKYETITPVQYGINTSSESYVDDGIRFIRTTDITDNGKLIKCGVYIKIDSVEDIYKTKINDVLISRSGTLGRTYIHNNVDVMTYGGYLVRFNFGDKTKSRFVFYYTKTKNFEYWLTLNTIQSTIGNVNGQKYSNMSLPIPSLPEQQQIVSFLDNKTQKIDELIKKTEQKIELLKEKRTALINHCVSKGLNPNVEMKDSGVEWIGEIPKHWVVMRPKSLVGNSNLVVQTGPFGAQLHASDYVENGVPLILIRNVKEFFIDDENIPKVSNEDAERLSIYRLDIGDIVFSRVGSIGRLALCTEREKGWLISGQMLRIRIRNPILNNHFALYSFSSESILTYIKVKSVGCTRESINTDILRNIPFILPPINEQQKIVDYIDKQNQKINNLIEKESKRIELLKEYRQSLISEVVTGKIDVRDEAIA